MDVEYVTEKSELIVSNKLHIKILSYHDIEGTPKLVRKRLDRIGVNMHTIPISALVSMAISHSIFIISSLRMKPWQQRL